MAKNLIITISESNWEHLRMLLERVPSSEFIKFCLLNEIIEEGMKRCEDKYFRWVNN